MTERGQAITLEAIVSGMVLLSSIVFALQMTAVTPLSASTSSQHIENQLEASAQGLLETAAADGSLKRTILYFNETSATFVDSDYRGYYAGTPPDTEFGQRLEAAFDAKGIAYNVRLRYENGGSERMRDMIYRGEPSDNAVAASTTIVLADDTPLYNGTGKLEARPVTVSDTSDFYAGDESSGSALYNVVRVEVIVWRI